MKKHIQIYLDYFELDTTSFICCEVCDRKAVDIHHIECRGRGGSKDKDKIENLMAVCRECHLEYGDKVQHIDFLKQIHMIWIKKKELSLLNSRHSLPPGWLDPISGRKDQLY